MRLPSDTIAMIDRGFAVGPLDGKAAFLPGGFKSFTADVSTIERLARRYPGRNWGGTCTGVVVVDEDPRNGGDLTEIGLDDAQTLVVRTGSGGRHVYFTYDGPIRGKVSGVDGIDLKRWCTGYTVMPGSIHPDTGRPYVIERDLPMAPLPRELLPRVTAQTYRPQPTRVNPERRSHGLVRRVAESTGGGRNQITFWAFCRALERGSSSLVDEIRDAALGTGLEDREIETCLRSAQRTTGRALT